MLNPNRPLFPKAELMLGLAAFLALALLFRFSELDLLLARWAYGSAESPWPRQGHPFIKLLHQFGEIPALTAAAVGLLAFAASFISPSKRYWRGPGLYLTLLFILGPGL